MATSITATATRDSTPNKWVIATGLAIALACLLKAPSLRAAEDHRGRQQHAQRNESRQTYQHGNSRRGGDDYRGRPGYVYGAPPLVYGPSAPPGIHLFLSL